MYRERVQGSVPRIRYRYGDQWGGGPRIRSRERNPEIRGRSSRERYQRKRVQRSEGPGIRSRDQRERVQGSGTRNQI